jgi:hypothetical protein
MSAETKVVIIGDSHTLAYAEAYSAEPTAYPSPTAGGLGIAKLFAFNTALKPFYEPTPDGGLRFTKAEGRETLAQLIGREHFLPNDPNVYLLSLGNTTIFLRAPMWKTYRPWRVAGPKHQPLSDAVMRELSLDFFQHVVGLFRELKAIGVNAAAVEAPQVRADEPTTAYIDPEGILEITRLCRGALFEALEAMDVPIVRSPQEAREDSYEGEQGFLRQDLWKRERGRDHHHANLDYGKIQLPRLLQRAGELAR